MKKEELLFVISGSNWTSESNNVSCLYSYDGNLLGTIWSKKEIEDEMVFYIFDKTSERFVESHDDTEWQCYEQFLDKLNKIWQYKQFEGLSSEQSYLYGGIWGGTEYAVIY